MITISKSQLQAWQPCDLPLRLAKFGSRDTLNVSQALEAGFTVSDILWVAGKLGLAAECVTFARRAADRAAAAGAAGAADRAARAADRAAAAGAAGAADRAAEAADWAARAAYWAAGVAYWAAGVAGAAAARAAEAADWAAYWAAGVAGAAAARAAEAAEIERQKQDLVELFS